jgi:hypothetical protein
MSSTSASELSGAQVVGSALIAESTVTRLASSPGCDCSINTSRALTIPTRR